MAKATIGTKTKGQSKRTVSGPMSAFGGSRGSVAATRCALPGLAPCPAPTYDTYRMMRSNPTIAIARAAMFAPVKAVEWTYEAKDGVPDERVEFIQQQFDDLKAQMVKDVLRSVEYGWQPFERVYGVKDGRYVLARAKPLLPDDTEPVVDPETLTVLGVENGKVKLDLRQAAIFTYDAEGDDPYGRSVYENIRCEAWWPWRDAAAKLAQYATKGAGVIPMIRYPLGQSQDENGSQTDNSEIAAQTLRALGGGNGVAVPNIWDPRFDDIARSGASVQDMMAWQISFLETRSGVGAELIDTMRHYEKLLVRGLYQPERSILEGQFGTKADAGSHGDLGLLMATELVEWVSREINRLFVDPLLVLNYGNDARGSVYIKAAPIRDDDREFIKNLTGQVLTANPDMLLAVADFDAMLDATGVPKSAEVVDVATATNPAAVPGQAPRPDNQAPVPTPTMASLAKRIGYFRERGIV